MSKRATTSEADPDTDRLLLWARVVSTQKQFERAYRAAVEAGVIKENGVVESSIEYIGGELIACVPEGVTT